MEHFLKFLVVGTIGFIINTLGLIGGVKLGLKPSLAGPLGGEVAIVSNFILNNFFTFSDRRIMSWQAVPEKFIQFNILSFGSLVIQFIFLKVGEKLFGMKEFKEPFIDLPVVADMTITKQFLKVDLIKKNAQKFSTYFVIYVLGVGVGLIVNFVIYSQIIWR